MIKTRLMREKLINILAMVYLGLEGPLPGNSIHEFVFFEVLVLDLLSLPQNGMYLDLGLELLDTFNPADTNVSCVRCCRNIGSVGALRA